MTEGSDDKCRKDIGIIHRWHKWSRGIVEIVSGGGIIEYWAPIFESEGPVQTFFIMLMFLLLKLKGLDKDDYLNWCHNFIAKIIAKFFFADV